MIRRTIVNYIKAHKKEWFDELLKESFVVVDPKDVLHIVSPNSAFFGDKELTSEEFEQIVREAERLKRSFLWNVISRELRFEASNLIAYKSKTEEDIIGGKMMLYCISTIEDLLDRLTNTN